MKRVVAWLTVALIVLAVGKAVSAFSNPWGLDKYKALPVGSTGFPSCADNPLCKVPD